MGSRLQDSVLQCTAGTPDSTTVSLSTSSVSLLEFTSTAPPSLLSIAVMLDPTAVFKARLVTLEFSAKPVPLRSSQPHAT